MKEALHQFLIGWGSIFVAPSREHSMPCTRITLPPDTVARAVAHDFGVVSADLVRAMERVEKAEQPKAGV
jgi:hypothetical protein